MRKDLLFLFFYSNLLFWTFLGEKVSFQVDFVSLIAFLSSFRLLYIASTFRSIVIFYHLQRPLYLCFGIKPLARCCILPPFSLVTILSSSFHQRRRRRVCRQQYYIGGTAMCADDKILLLFLVFFFLYSLRVN